MQVTPQLMPAGLLVTVPDPVGETVKVNCGGGGGAVLKVAVTFLAELIVTLHAPVPAQTPPHPANTEPAAGAAAKLTIVPEA